MAWIQAIGREVFVESSHNPYRSHTDPEDTEELGDEVRIGREPMHAGRQQICVGYRDGIVMVRIR